MFFMKEHEKLAEYIAKYELASVFTRDIKLDAEFVVFTRGEHICRAGEKLDRLYFLVEGKAKVYTCLSNGNTLLLQFYKPLKVIGDIEFIHTNTATANVQAIEESHCIAVSFEDIRQHYMEDSRFLRFMCTSLGEKLNKFSKYSAINLLSSLENRLASYLLAVIPEDDKQSPAESIYSCNLTEISQLLGTSYRHLLRSLEKLCQQGIISKKGGDIRVLDRAKLEEKAVALYE